MVFSKENKPKEVTDEIAAMTVYKVVRVKGDEMYSPYYKEKKIISIGNLNERV